jgi:peroxiredoxin
LELEALNEVLSQIKAVEASLVVITPQLEAFSKDMRQRLKLGFDILSDSRNQVASQFGLTFSVPEDLKGVYQKFGIDLARFNGDDSWTLPVPARFIVDQQSRIRAAAADPDYTIRPEPDDTVRLLRELTALPQSA